MNGYILNIGYLIAKEFQILFRDKIMLVLIFYSFSFAIYIAAKAASVELVNTPIVFVDEDRSVLSLRIKDSFYKPTFNNLNIVSYDEMDRGMDRGEYTFSLVIPSGFEKDMLSGKKTRLQLNIDATRISEAAIGAGYISEIVSQEVSAFLNVAPQKSRIELVPTYMYNSNLEGEWFGSISEVIDNIMTFSILLAAASLMREREHGTIEHLLVMPIDSIQIILSKIVSTVIIVSVSILFSLYIVVETILNVPLAGSVPLFLFSSFLVLFSTASIGIFIGTITKSMPQMGMMFILVILPLMMLSGGITPYESMPEILQYLMRFSPTSHFIDVAQAILFRGASIDVIYRHLLAIVAIGFFFFFFALATFKKSIES